ncbi:MAG: glycosyltransferase family 2 protein [Micropruina sp.]|nr:glycosyltransferase family 2 protein [Micropruina sp.]
MDAVTSDLVPIRCLTWSLDEPAERLRPNADGRLFVLALDEGWPRAVVDVRADSAERAAAVVRAAVAASDVTPPDGWTPGQQAGPAVSVVVCTLGRDPRLTETVAALLAQAHPLELIVVDNDPASGSTAALLDGVADPRLRIVAEPRRGLSIARNTGVRAAAHDLVAFTDDDALPAPGWVAELAAVFGRDPSVACVTGLVLPAEVVTRSQLFFEEAGGFDKGLRARHWNLAGDGTAVGSTPGPRGVAFPFDGGFGSGNNMAFRRAWLDRLGGFDVALGAGSIARGGEDLDVFQATYLAGGTVVYWPAALVRHHHRADHAGLLEQMHGYGVGMAAVVTKRFLTSPAAAVRVIGRLPSGLRLLLDPGSAKNRGKTAAFPADVTRAERLGYLAGPWAYLRSRRHARRRPVEAG